MAQSELLRQTSKLVAEAKDPLAEVRAIVLKNGCFSIAAHVKSGS